MGKKFDKIWEAVVSRSEVGGYLPGDIIKFRDGYKNTETYKYMPSTLKKEVDELATCGLNIKVVQVGDKQSGYSIGNQFKPASQIVLTIAADHGGGRTYGRVVVCPDMVDMVDVSAGVPVPDQFKRKNTVIIKPKQLKIDPKIITNVTDKGNGKNTPTDLKLAGESTRFTRDNNTIGMLYENIYTEAVAPQAQAPAPTPTQAPAPQAQAPAPTPTQTPAQQAQAKYDIQMIEAGVNHGSPVYKLMINNIFSGAFFLNQQTNTVTFYNSDMKNQVSPNLPYPETASTFKPQLDPLNGQQFRGVGLEGFKQKINSVLSGTQQAPTQQPAQAPPTQPVVGESKAWDFTKELGNIYDTMLHEAMDTNMNDPKDLILHIRHAKKMGDYQKVKSLTNRLRTIAMRMDMYDPDILDIIGEKFDPKQADRNKNGKLEDWEENIGKKVFGDDEDEDGDEEEEECGEEEEQDACYKKVKSRYDVWPSAYASGALVKCRKVGAKNWGNSKK